MGDTDRAGMRNWAWACVATLALASVVAGCARPAGDLGRARTGVVEHRLEPEVARFIDGLASGQERSRLPHTDEEKRMNDALWRFFTSPHAREWSYTGQAKLNNVELVTGKAFDYTDRYYVHLLRYDFRSSAVRYRTMHGHIQSDLATLPAAFDALCAVQKLDVQRQTATYSFPELGEDRLDQVHKRITENERTAMFFSLALDFRYEAYSYALKRLLVEAPDAGARSVDTALSDLAVWQERAARRSFCGTPTGQVAVNLTWADVK